jgi:hypothetical protein
MSPLAVDDADIIRSIVAIVRSLAPGPDRRSPGSRPDALKHVRYILYRIGIVAPDLFKRIEIVLMERLSPEDWKSLRMALKSDAPQSRPLPRRSRSRVKELPF